MILQKYDHNMAKPPRMAWLGHANLPKTKTKEKMNKI
jgi:hypothetical protein